MKRMTTDGFVYTAPYLYTANKLLLTNIFIYLRCSVIHIFK